MKKQILFLVSLFIAIQVIAQPERPTETDKNIVIETKHSALVYSVGKNKKLYQVYLGEKLNNTADYRLQRNIHEAYVPSGTDNLFEPAIKMLHNDGNPSLELLFAEEKNVRDGNLTTTTVILKDPVYPVTIKLNFVAYFDEDIVKTWTEIFHQEKNPVVLTNFASAMIHLDADRYWLTQFHGDWAKEMRMEESQLTSGIKTIDSKLGHEQIFIKLRHFFLQKINRPLKLQAKLLQELLVGQVVFNYYLKLIIQILSG